MSVISRLSHILTKPGALRHEAYMSMYAYVVSACVMPVYIIALHIREARHYHKLDEIPLYAKVTAFMILFFLLLIKNFWMERGIMKRFIEDYNPDVHENFPCFDRGEVLTTEHSRDFGEEESDANYESRALTRNGSMTDKRYTNHVEGE